MVDQQTVNSKKSLKLLKVTQKTLSMYVHSETRTIENYPMVFWRNSWPDWQNSHSFTQYFPRLSLASLFQRVNSMFTINNVYTFARNIRPYRTVTKTRIYEHEQKHDKQLLYCFIQMKWTIFREVLMPITDWTTNEWFSHVQQWPYSFSKVPYWLWNCR